ncbi:MAG: glutamate racemase [Candidatus Eiseniibacteriota bacterium]|nr:MAG: glutamate racemase [Candidatus Eisenbacteria bacterium]
MNSPIGVFDSGIGGLTVVKHLASHLRDESIVYFGDTARVPYGSKSEETVKRFAFENTKFLLKHGVKLVVVACNTASAVALDDLQRSFDVPVVGMIEPGARAAVRLTRRRSVGVIGTLATIESSSYERAIHAEDASVKTTSRPCPLFVPLAEEGWVSHPVSEAVAREYLDEFKTANIDVLVLGCTHYPVLRNIIQRAIGEHVRLVDSGEEAVKEVTGILKREGLEAAGGGEVYRHFYVSDIPRKFREIGERFLGRPIDGLTLVPQSDVPWYERAEERRC